MERALARASRRWDATRRLRGRPLRSAAVLFATILVGALLSAGAQAAPGDLDLTFSGDGKQRSDFASAGGEAAAIVRQPDGKLVAVGNTNDNFALARYNPNGSLDVSFSGDGRQTTDFGASDDEARGVALQPDGKIVAVGETGGDFALARYNPNGSLDPGFSGDGRQTTDLGGSDAANGVALQADGKIVAVGFTPSPANYNFALARYNPNGSLDVSFSGDGTQTTDFGGTDFANGVALQANGKIVAVGVSGGFAIARYNPNGSLDTSFSGDGRQTTDFGGGSGASGVALQPDGKIVAVGFTPSPYDFALARYNPNGSLDPGFSGDGKQTTDLGGSDVANGVALQADGRIIVVGRGAADRDFALARYNPNGSLDPSFAGDGLQTTDFGGIDEANGVAVQADGKVVAVGVGAGFAIARYNPNGSLDVSFSGDGRQTTEFPGPDFASGVALQADGRIVTVGATGKDFGLARYNPNGSLDSRFSGDGKQRTDFGSNGDGASGVALQADGKVVVVGRYAARGGFAIARYNPNGSLDTSFSGDGKQLTFHRGDNFASGVALQPNGKIVVVGGGGVGFALARYNPNGSLDASFSGDGKQTTDFAGRSWATGVALQPNGRIVAVGAAGEDFALARYNPNGSLDTSFSGDGGQTTDFGGSDVASGVTLQADGRIVVVGRATAPGGDFGLARYNPNGSLDSSFSGDGQQRTDFGGSDAASGVALQANGRIVAVGTAGGNFGVARYNPNGTLDRSFSGDGGQTTDFGGSDGASGVALQADGRIVAVGRGLGTDRTTDFALARYLGG